MADVKVIIVEKDGVELAEDTEYKLTTTDIPEGTAKYFTDARVTASPQVSANTAQISENTSQISTNTAAIATKASDSVVVKTVNGKSPTSGAVTLADTDIPFSATGTQYTSTTVHGALLEAKELLVVTSDPSQSPGLAASLGTLAFKKTDPVGFWQKKGTLNTDWSGVAYGYGGGSGVTPPFVFSKSGTAGPGTYLRVGEAVTSNAGQPIKGLNNIVEVRITNGLAVASVTRVQFQKRTSVSTWADITGAYVDIAVGAYKASNTGLTIALGMDEEISAYVQSGSTLSNPIAMIYLVPK